MATYRNRCCKSASDWRLRVTKKIRPHHEHDPVLQPLGRCHGLDLDRLFENLGAGIVILVQPRDRRKGAEVL